MSMITEKRVMFLQNGIIPECTINNCEDFPALEQACTGIGWTTSWGTGYYIKIRIGAVVLTLHCSDKALIKPLIRGLEAKGLDMRAQISNYDAYMGEEDK